jgi:acetylornithine aminotransferase
MAKGVAAEQLGPGDHGSTYGGNPLCCAAAQAVLTALAEDGVMQQATLIREALVSALRDNLCDASLISEVRGKGLMIGIQPNTATGEIVMRGLDHGLLLNIAGGDTIRVLPPLVMTLEQAGELGAGIARILNDVAEQEDKT